MKKILFMLLLSCLGIGQAEAQNQIRVYNNTSCPVPYTLYMVNAGCVAAGNTIMYTLNPGQQTAHDVNLVTWAIGSPGPTSTFSVAKCYLNQTICPSAYVVGIPCAGVPASTTVLSACPPQGCPSYTAQWSQSQGGGYILRFN